MKQAEAVARTSTEHGAVDDLHEALALAHALAARLAHTQADAESPYSLRLTRALSLDLVELLEEAESARR